jgi:hypothetical protein
MKTVKIVTPVGDDLVMGQRTKVLDDNGHEIKGITSIRINILCDEFITAEIGMYVSFDEIDAIPEYYITDPDTGERKQMLAIHFKDGTVWRA